MIINEYKTGMGTCTIGSATDGIAFVDSETNSKYIFTYSYANAKVYKIENNTANLYWDCGNAIIETYRHYNFARYKNGIIGISTYDNIISGESSTDIDVIQIDIINSVYTYNRNIQTSMASQLYNVYDYSYIYNNNPSGHCNAFGGVNALYYDKWIYFYNDNRYYRVSIDGQFEVCNSDIHGSVVKSRYTDPYNLNIFFTSKADTESGFIIIFNGDEGINIIAPDIQVQNTNTFIKVKE